MGSIGAGERRDRLRRGVRLLGGDAAVLDSEIGCVYALKARHLAVAFHILDQPV
ncbi:MAG: hypothetical protein ABI323_15105 [Solirubrobacteraceae bacterium]